MNDKPTIQPKTLPPLTKFIYTLGVLPTSYLMSMTYEEQLVWLCNYLGTQVIPAVNQNGEAVQELQSLYELLQTYVNESIEAQNTYINNYFNNLDVQEEINNKLDDMLENGELDEIIQQFLQSNVFWTFDTVADMKAATNVIDGSYAETLGYYTINDGGASRYLIQETQPVSGYYETLTNGLYALLLIEEEVKPEQFGAYGDGTTDDSVPFATAISIVKNTNKVLKLNKSYYITTPITLNQNDRLNIIGNENNMYENRTYNIIIGNNDLFRGANLSEFTDTRVGINMENVSFTATDGSMGTLFKGFNIRKALWNKCFFYKVFGVIEGSFGFCSSLQNCHSINIRNFFISDYIFSTPTYLKDIRNGTTTIDSVTVYTSVTSDSNNLFESCYFNGYNPTSAYTSLDMPCFHLLYYNDSEVCGNNCFLDFWYAIEESFRTSGNVYNISWKGCVFQYSIYFFAFHTTNYPIVRGFEFVGNELVNFGKEQGQVTDKNDYADARLNIVKNIFQFAVIKDNIFDTTNRKIILNKKESYMHTTGNKYNRNIGCPVESDTTQTYNDEAIRESKYEELNDLVYEVDTLPDTISRSAGTVNDLGIYFNGRKFLFKVDDTYYYRTLVRLDNTYSKFV